MMSLKLFINFFFFILYITNGNTSISSYVSPSDRKKLLTTVVKSLIINENDDYSSSYYAAKTFKLVNEPIIEVLVKDNCNLLKTEYDVTHTTEITYQCLSAWFLLGCKGNIHTDTTLSHLRSRLESEKSTVAEIHYALELLKLLGQSVTNTAKIAQTIQDKLNGDDSLLSIGHALHAANHLGNSGKFALSYIDDLLQQTDEIDGKLLQWEGGLSVTSLLLTGILRLPGAKSLTQEQAEKFASYLLSRRTVQTPKGVLALFEALYALTSFEETPVSISVIGSAQITLDKPELKVRVSDVLGNPLKKFPGPVIAQSATRIADDVVVLSKQPLTAGSGSTEFLLPLNLEPGQFRIILTTGTHSTTINVRVLGPVKLQGFEIGLSDTFGNSAPHLIKLEYPNKLTEVLQADSSQHLIAKFLINRKVHQTFLRLYSAKKEILFVAEPEINNKFYKLEVNLASELAHSGNFQMQLILGDSVMSNPIRWSLGEIELNLGTPAQVTKTIRGPKPEIQHIFRPADKRPSEAVSMLFTALTASPLLLLIILWFKTGINFGNFTVLSIPFHLGFASILCLFTLFWLKLDMFLTCAWLIPIGGFTFLSGQKLLSHIAKHRRI